MINIDIYIALDGVIVRRSGWSEFSGPVVFDLAHFQREWILHDLKADPSQLRIMHVEGDSMMPTLHSGDVVLVDLARRSPTPPGIFVLFDGMGLVAKRLEHIPNHDPPKVRVISDNTFYSAYERTADEISIIGRIRWFAREI